MLLLEQKLRFADECFHDPCSPEADYCYVATLRSSRLSWPGSRRALDLPRSGRADRRPPPHLCRPRSDALPCASSPRRSRRLPRAFAWDGLRSPRFRSRVPAHGPPRCWHANAAASGVGLARWKQQSPAMAQVGLAGGRLRATFDACSGSKRLSSACRSAGMFLRIFPLASRPAPRDRWCPDRARPGRSQRRLVTAPRPS